MNENDLRYLIALAEFQHFGKAADACDVSQPTISQQLKKIEATLGILLFERMSKQVVPTAAGEMIVAAAQRALREFEDMRKVAHTAQKPEHGQISLGIFPTLGPYLLPHLLPTLHNKFPRLKILIREEKTALLLKQLDKGSIDLALLAMPVDDTNNEWLHVFSEMFLLAVHPEHPLAKKSQIHSRNLSGRQLLLLDEGHCFREQVLAWCERSGAIENSSFRATSLPTLKQMVAIDSEAATLVPALAKGSEAPSLSYIPFVDSEKPKRDIALVWRKSAVFSDFYRLLGKEIGAICANLNCGLAQL